MTPRQLRRTLVVVSSLLALPIVVQSQGAARSSAALTTWTATERWRVDGTEGGASGFGDVRDLLVGADSTLWVLDFKEQAIRRYAPSGRLLGVVGRAGAGPGEFRNANGMLRHGDGTVWVNDPANGRFSLFRADGTFARQHLLPSFGFSYRWEAWFDRVRNEVVESSVAPVGDDYRSVWRRIAADGTSPGRLDVPACADPEAIATRLPIWRAESPNGSGAGGPYPFSAGGGHASLGDGTLWCADPRAPRAARLRLAGGDTVAVTAPSITPLPVTPAERTQAIADLRTRLARYTTNDFDPARVPSTKPPIASLHVDDDGRLWIRHSEASGPPRTTFDVHDQRGQHLGRVVVPYRAAYAPPRARGRSLWLAVVDEDGVVSIARFALSP